MTKAKTKSPPSKKTASTKRKPAGTELKPFERVWNLVRRIPEGRVATYGQLSEMIERRLTPVGVGWALRAVPPGALPWHRVVNGGGGVSTDPEHPGLQRQLLEAEGVVFERDGRIDLARFAWRPRMATPAAGAKKAVKPRR